MRVSINMAGDEVYAVLSRRNLQTLLNKLDDPTSVRTLLITEAGLTLVVTTEEDEEHYPSREPGRVHPSHDPALRTQREQTTGPWLRTDLKHGGQA